MNKKTIITTLLALVAMVGKHKRKENTTSAALSLMESGRYIFIRLRDWEAVCSSTVLSLPMENLQ